MQLQNTGLYASSYQNPYHIVLPGPQDHELKKQYLALLPPQQIIEICLNFDIHVPPYVKSSIWPADINAAIAAIKNTSPAASEHPPASSSFSTDVPPTAHSLPESTDRSATTTEPKERSTEVQPPDKPSSTSEPSPVPQGQTDTAAPTPQNPSAPTQQPPYPHQPYGYGHHPPSAYPHAPYYPHAPGYPPYPSPYPYGTYPPPHPGYPQQPSVPFAPPPLTHPPQPPQDGFNPTVTPGTDDLPSYEEMMAEALTESGDPEGCAPKELFTWMASRYPLQSNFRPSASQALQKALKRGRFEKNSNGKYKLNATWEGGNTSRRVTRRPQTQTSSAATQASASPFTHAPLAHHQHPHPSHGYQPYGYLYPQQPGHLGYMQPPQANAQTSQSPALPLTSATPNATTSAHNAPHPIQTEGAVRDAWEAAQNILKAINFDSLLQLPQDEEEGVNQVSASSHAAGHAPVSSHAGANALVGNTEASTPSGRAELQANLALLAAQLAEIAQEDDDDPVIHYPILAGSVVAPTAAAEQVMNVATNSEATPAVVLPLSSEISNDTQRQPPVAEEEEEDSEDDDMEEVI